jgi:hypothetical protein
LDRPEVAESVADEAVRVAALVVALKLSAAVVVMAVLKARVAVELARRAV